MLFTPFPVALGIAMIAIFYLVLIYFVLDILLDNRNVWKIIFCWKEEENVCTAIRVMV